MRWQEQGGHVGPGDEALRGSGQDKIGGWTPIPRSDSGLRSLTVTPRLHNEKHSSAYHPRHCLPQPNRRPRPLLVASVQACEEGVLVVIPRPQAGAGSMRGCPWGFVEGLGGRLLGASQCSTLYHTYKIDSRSRPIWVLGACAPWRFRAHRGGDHAGLPALRGAQSPRFQTGSYSGCGGREGTAGDTSIRGPWGDCAACPCSHGVLAGLLHRQAHFTSSPPHGLFQESNLDSTRVKGQFEGFTAGTV